MKIRFRKLISYYRPYRALFLAVMASALVVAGIALAFPLLIRSISKVVLAGGTQDVVGHIVRVAAAMLALIAVRTVCGFLVDYHGHAMGARMEADLRQELFEHYQKLSFSFFDRRMTGELMSRITNDLLNLAEMFHHGPEDVVIYSVRFIGAFVVLAAIDAPLTLAVFALIPFMAWFAFFFGKRMYYAVRTNRQRIGDINALVEQNLSGVRVVKSFANEDAESARFADRNARFLDSRRNTYRNEAYFSAGIDAFSLLTTVVILAFGAVALSDGSLDVADLLTFLLYVGNLTEPIKGLVHVASQYQDGIAGFERFMEVMEVEPEVNDAPDAVELGRAQGRVEFRSVAFRYDSRQEDVLQDISLDARPGDYIALVGPSGVGKTTLCSLIPRFYDVSEGELLLDGINVKDIRLRSLRRNVGVVQQDVYLFAGTVLDNIRYGKPGARMEEVIDAAKKANAHEFILRLPQGYETDIGQRGVKLSGGQQQRLSIARVFLKDPPVLILDEATSALDTESERAVQESFEALARDRTTFVIAHRLSTIRNAKRIAVLAGRGIVEQGTHAELLASNGAYARMYRLQFEGLDGSVDLPDVEPREESH